MEKLHFEKSEFFLKKTICCAAAILLALLLFVTLTCELLHVKIELWGISVGFGFNGFQMLSAFSGLSENLELGSAVFCLLISCLILIYALALIVWAVLTFFLANNEEKLKSIQITFFSYLGTSAALNLLYMIAGIAFAVEMKDAIGSYYDISTVAWLAFVLSLLFGGVCIAFFAKFLNKIIPTETAPQQEQDPVPAAKYVKARKSENEERSIELLLKYKQLYEQGILSQEEFERKKQSLLNL